MGKHVSKGPRLTLSPHFPKAVSIVEIPRGQDPKVDSTLNTLLPQQRQPGTKAKCPHGTAASAQSKAFWASPEEEALRQLCQWSGGLLCQELQEVTQPKNWPCRGLQTCWHMRENPRQDYSVPGKRKGDEKVQKQTWTQSVVNSSDYSRVNQKHLTRQQVRRAQETNPESCADHNSGSSQTQQSSPRDYRHEIMMSRSSPVLFLTERWSL